MRQRRCQEAGEGWTQQQWVTKLLAWQGTAACEANRGMGHTLAGGPTASAWFSKLLHLPLSPWLRTDEHRRAGVGDSLEDWNFVLLRIPILQSTGRYLLSEDNRDWGQRPL